MVTVEALFGYKTDARSPDRADHLTVTGVLARNFERISRIVMDTLGTDTPVPGKVDLLFRHATLHCKTEYDVVFTVERDVADEPDMDRVVQITDEFSKILPTGIRFLVRLRQYVSSCAEGVGNS